jgi:hypothetical protein
MFLVAKIKVTFTFDLLTSKLKLPLNDLNCPATPTIHAALPNQYTVDGHS